MTGRRTESLAANLSVLQREIDECVHCGFCLPTCPTYAETGREADSPRGRIYLIQALAKGTLQPGENVLTPIDRCLECRACETACPSGVRYGAILEGARAATEPHRTRSPFARFLRWLGFEAILPRRTRLRWALRAAAILRESGLPEVLERSGWTAWLPGGTVAALSFAPRIRETRETFGDQLARRGPTRDLPARPPQRGVVALHHGCVMDFTMSQVHHDTADVLRANGFAVRPVPKQACCGALHVHAGRPETARRLARDNVFAFHSAAVDAIITNASGCGAQLHEYAELLQHDLLAFSAAQWAGEITRDFAAFLEVQGLRPPTQAIPRHAVYDAPCHQFHAQGVDQAPLRLLRAIPGLTLKELEESEWCCGSAGIYNLTQPELANRLLDRKLDHIEAAGVDLVVTSNPGCMLQLRLGIARRHLPIEVQHLATVLAQAYGQPGAAIPGHPSR